MMDYISWKGSIWIQEHDHSATAISKLLKGRLFRWLNRLVVNLIICRLERLQFIKGIRYNPFRPRRRHQIARCWESAQISMNIQIMPLVCHRELDLIKVIIIIPNRVQASNHEDKFRISSALRQELARVKFCIMERGLAKTECQRTMNSQWEKRKRTLKKKKTKSSWRCVKSNIQTRKQITCWANHFQRRSQVEYIIKKLQVQMMKEYPTNHPARTFTFSAGTINPINTQIKKTKISKLVLRLI